MNKDKEKYIKELETDVWKLKQEVKEYKKDIQDSFDNYQFKLKMKIGVKNEPFELLKAATRLLMSSIDYIKPHIEEELESEALTLNGAILNWLDDLEELIDFDRPEKYQ